MVSEMTPMRNQNRWWF